MSTPKHSKRAKILAQVLPYIDSDDWDEFNGFIVFGKEAFERHCYGEPSEDSNFDDSLRNAITNIKANRGERFLAGRTSLEGVPNNLTESYLLSFFERFSPEEISQLQERLSKSGRSACPVIPDDADVIDAALTWNALDILDQSFARVSTWDEIEIDRRTVKNAQYFDEAHKCDLFGLRIACAVLCRAVLEESLKKVVDSTGAINRAIRPSDSYIELMLNQAVKDKLIDSERRQAGITIRNAGNNAIHDVASFTKLYSKRLRGIVDDTRKIVFDLYSV